MPFIESTGGGGYSSLPLSVAAGEVVPNNTSVFGPFGRLDNRTGGNITVSATPDPPTAASLQADEFTVPDFITATDYVATYNAAKTTST